MNGDNVYYKVAVITDRGLSKKRPLNEDSYFADPERGLFAVADGVGGASAGEVASQTAMEVLSEAFRHQGPKMDDEDLMELAIQRANASIHQMSKEHPKLSMMATTIVALHLNGKFATIGHAGDSRLYRLTPGGKLFRETRDHSVVEEEVRAGRMSPEQALHHPSRNVISRALGAEETVDVEMKVIEVVDGTTFLLCSDGITRHISDDELREMMVSYQDLDSVCQMFRSLCYERGAEDNLTAVLVSIHGAVSQATEEVEEEEVTISTTRPLVAETVSLEDYKIPTAEPELPTNDFAVETPVFEEEETETEFEPDEAQTVSSGIVTFEEPPKKKSSFAWSFVKFILILLLLIIVAAGAFYAGFVYKERSMNSTTPSTQTTNP